MNTQLHRTLKTTPYEVVFGIKPFSEPVHLVVIKEHEDQASDTSEISEYDMSDSSCSSDQTEKHKMKQQFKETSEHTAGNYTTIILLFCYL